MITIIAINSKMITYRCKNLQQLQFANCELGCDLFKFCMMYYGKFSVKNQCVKYNIEKSENVENLKMLEINVTKYESF